MDENCLRRIDDSVISQLKKDFEDHLHTEKMDIEAMKGDIKAIRDSVQELVAIWTDTKGTARIIAKVSRFILWAAAVSGALAALFGIYRDGGPN